MPKTLINVQNCSVSSKSRQALPALNWKMAEGEAWLVTGANGSGTAEFIQALSGELDFVPQGKDAAYSNEFSDKTAVVSLEKAAALIEEERLNDESEILNREDEGRSGRRFLYEVIGGNVRRNDPLPPIADRLDSFPEVKLCGVEKILDRGLRYMSTGEIRRLLLCRALLSGSKLLILSNPFAGLDASSRALLLEFFDSMASRQVSAVSKFQDFPRVILCTDRFSEIPKGINHVLEFANKTISFCGVREEYEMLHEKQRSERNAERERRRQEFLGALETIRKDTLLITQGTVAPETPDELICFKNVNIGWGDNTVLVNMSWTVRRGEHWFIRGPNGSGKTTLLELITGDNMQVFREDVSLFGRRRGTGETLWDIRRRLGIVSYRLHVEYRMVDGTTVQNVIISGFHDSIGLYEAATDFERAMAMAWLRLAGFEDKANEAFGSLSYGEQRAVLILRAAVKNPCVLILDEPCHGLDEKNRDFVRDLLETIAETGTTTLLHVTHDPSEVLKCERHILELRPGETPMYSIQSAL